MRQPSYSIAGSRTNSDSMDWYASEPWVHYGVRTVTYLCCGLLALSMLVPVSGTIVTSGTVSVEGDYTPVQHLEGGIVSKVLVHAGDRVQYGDVLIQMDDTQLRANLDATKAKFNDYAIQEARLLAERDLREQFEAPDTVDLTAAQTMDLFQVQKSLFDARRTTYLDQKQMLNQRITQTASDLTTASSLLETRKKELLVNEIDLSNVRPLFEKGSGSMQRIGPLQRENVRIRSDIINLKAQISTLKSSRAEAEARLADIERDVSRQAAEDLQSVRAVLAEQTAALKEITDKLTEADIRAPSSGIVHAITVLTEGRTIQPGRTLLQIIPDDHKVLIETKINPEDIDTVHVGQSATVRISSFGSHILRRLDGIVREVSESEITGEDGKAFYSAHVEVPPDEYLKLEAGSALVPGMPVEVNLETPPRKILSYVLGPLADIVPQTFAKN